MRNNETIEKKVDQTLELMDQMETLKAGPYFYSQIQARLHSAGRQESTGFFPFLFRACKLRPVYLSLLMLVNIVSASFFLMSPPASVAHINRTEYKTQAAQMLQDYDMNRNTYADQITEKMVREESQ